MLQISKAILVTLLFASVSFAQSRVLECTSRSTVTGDLTEANTVEFGICGVRACTASVVKNGAAPVTYNVKRTKSISGALIYTPVANASRRCTFNISKLSNGIRRITNTPLCNTALKRATCVFIDR